MTINTSALSSTLQSKVDALDAATETKEVLLLSKALDAAAGSISVNDVLAEGVVQTNNVNTLGATKIAEINTVATNTFKTVGGASILGSGDIATLPSQSGASGKVLKSDGTTAAWGESGKILQMVQYNYSGAAWLSATTWVDTPIQVSINPLKADSTFWIDAVVQLGHASHDSHAVFNIKDSQGATACFTNAAENGDAGGGYMSNAWSTGNQGDVDNYRVSQSRVCGIYTPTANLGATRVFKVTAQPHRLSGTSVNFKYNVQPQLETGGHAQATAGCYITVWEISA